jgi:hypothetical protein
MLGSVNTGTYPYEDIDFSQTTVFTVELSTRYVETTYTVTVAL